MAEFPAIFQLTKEYDNIYCSVGVHPHEAEKEVDVTTQELIEKASLPKVIGIGETGLDYFYEHSPRIPQQEVFRKHIHAAQATGLPLIVHTRDAEEDTMRIMEEEYAKAKFTGLIHCFTASKDLAERSIAIGFYISISGILTFPKAETLRDTVATLPLEKLLVETDAPYLAPAPHRGKRNEPAFTRHTLSALAALKGVSEEECARITTDNFFNLFSKAVRPMNMRNI